MLLSVSRFTAVATIALTVVKTARAETHTVIFDNRLVIIQLLHVIACLELLWIGVDLDPYVLKLYMK